MSLLLMTEGKSEMTLFKLQVVFCYDIIDLIMLYSTSNAYRRPGSKTKDPFIIKRVLKMMSIFIIKRVLKMSIFK